MNALLSLAGGLVFVVTATGAVFGQGAAPGIGSGSSDTTWQAMAGIGYSYRWGDVVLAYRHLAYKQGGDKLLEDISLGGPVLGVNFRF